MATYEFSHDWMSDTHPDALLVYLEIHRRRPPERKLGDVAAMYDAEDTVLEKLAWYKRDGQTSDQQWSDVLGIVTTRELDREYLREWAPKPGGADLLERLFGEAGHLA